MGSFEEYLRPIMAYVPPALISPSAFSDINSVASVLPATLAHNMFFFECRLGERAPRADFCVLARSSCGRSSLAGLHPTSTLPARLMTDTVWRRVEDFAVHWADPSSPLYHAVDNVWLEFDVDGPPPDVPVPSIFFAPQSNGQMDDIEVAGEPNAEGRLATVERTIRLLAGGEPPPRMLEGCFRALSSDEKVFQVGLMLSRGEDAVRLCIRLRSVKRIMEYLTVVGWPGDEADLRGVLEPLARSVDRVMLAIDVGDAVRPKIGLECCFGGNRQPRREPRWGAFLNSLVLSGLCTADKREALLAYPGHVDEAAHTVPWPAALRRASQLLGGRSLSTFVRSLNHVKIVYRPGEPLEAKAYLAGNHHWHMPAFRSSQVAEKERHGLSFHEEHRLARARRRGRQALASLANEASRTPLALICQPPPPAKPFPYGDVVPLGFLLRAVNADTSPTSSVRRSLEDLLRDKRQGFLWSYHSDTLVTCIDSALVLQGFRDPASIPFYSAVTIPRGRIPGACSPGSAWGEARAAPLARGQNPQVSLYVDGHHMISSALALLSLTQPGSPTERDAPPRPMQRRENCHPRCRCADHMEYIAGYALPPYVVG